MPVPTVGQWSQIDLELGPSDAAVVTTKLGRGWKATYRLALQRGVSVIAGLSIEPWGSGVPPGGLSARLLRTLKFTLPRRELRRLAEIVQKHPVVYEGRFQSSPFLATEAQASRREYLKGRQDSFYAEIAKQYCKLAGSHVKNPIQVIAKSRSLSPSKVRDMIFQARKRGLLTKPPKQGRMGGELTLKCIALLTATPPKVRRKKH
jgi:hypothetical protein